MSLWHDASGPKTAVRLFSVRVELSDIFDSKTSDNEEKIEGDSFKLFVNSFVRCMIRIIGWGMHRRGIRLLRKLMAGYYGNELTTAVEFVVRWYASHFFQPVRFHCPSRYRTIVKYISYHILSTIFAVIYVKFMKCFQIPYHQ
jgi:hypothetical protein